MAHIIDGYLEKADWRVKENSNRSYSIQGLNMALAEEVTAKFCLEKVYPKSVSDAHKEGFLHIHDLGNGLAGYCTGWDLMDLLLRGFGGVRGKITTKPAKHLRVALLHAVNFLYTVQNEVSGAVAFSNFDTLMAGFIRSDGLSYEEVKQSLQEFIYNINVPTRQGSQTPFTCLTLDLEVPKHLADTPAIIGGKPCDFTYGELQKELDMFNRAFAEVMLEGDFAGRPFSFPIPTYSITDSFDWDNPNHEALWKMTAKYGNPSFSNFVGSDMSPEDVRAMCCFRGDTRLTCMVDGAIRTIEMQKLCKSKTLGGVGDSSLFVPRDGEWVRARAVKVPYQNRFFEISLRNGHTITVTDNHIHPTKEGDVVTTMLSVGDSLRWSSEFPDYDGVGGFDIGWIVGLYLAEGSRLGKTGIQFSVGASESAVIEKTIRLMSSLFSAYVGVFKNTGNSTTLAVNSKPVRAMIDSYVAGKGPSKKLVFYKRLSKEMLQGIFDGWMAGDGKKDGKEAYSSSVDLIKQMGEVCFILGINTNIRKYERTASMGGRDYTGNVYALHVCDTQNGRVYKKENGHLFCEITEIKEVGNRNKVAFCVEVIGDDIPYFNIANGLYTHNCRLRLDMNNGHLRKKGGGLFGSNPKTGSIGVVSINLARLGYLAENEAEFMEGVYAMMEKAKDALEVKRELIERLSQKGLYPYSYFYLDGKPDSPVWGNHFSTIGIIGMNDAILNLFGYGIEDERGRDFAIKALKGMRDMVSVIQCDTKHPYNLEATPAEGASMSLARKDAKAYPEIKFYNVEFSGGTTPYYTNSTQLPAATSLNLFEALDHQDELQSIYTGGTIFHAFLGERCPDFVSVKELVKKVVSNYHLPYFSVTPTFSVCADHGYLSGEHIFCPECGKRAEVYSRVVGYIRPIEQWNDGKLSEFFERTTYKEDGRVYGDS
jgi:anaerobic ribonucleoside-triphosphate reductase